MQIVVKGKNVDVTEALRAHAEKRISKIERYFDRIISTDVTLSTERNWHIVEVTLHANNGHVLRGEERTNDMYSSIDKVIEKLEKQVKKEKGKGNRKGRGSHLGEELAAAAPAEPGMALPAPGEADIHSLEPHVEALKRYNAPPTSVEQAVKEIEESGDDFYVFNNVRNGRVNVLYRLPKGYGLIDPIPT